MARIDRDPLYWNGQPWSWRFDGTDMIRVLVEDDEGMGEWLGYLGKRVDLSFTAEYMPREAIVSQVDKTLGEHESRTITLQLLRPL